MTPIRNWRPWLVRLILLLWGLQILWLIWHFGPEGRDLARRIAQGHMGQAVRQEDPFYQWLTALAKAMPRNAAYIFLDNYEAGKEIQARYHLTPRRHILLPPEVPPSFLFHAVRREKATFLLIRTGAAPLGPGARAAANSPAFRPVELGWPGKVYQVDYRRIQGSFYD